MVDSSYNNFKLGLRYSKQALTKAINALENSNGNHGWKRSKSFRLQRKLVKLILNIDDEKYLKVSEKSKEDLLTSVEKEVNMCEKNVKLGRYSFDEIIKKAEDPISNMENPQVLPSQVSSSTGSHWEQFRPQRNLASCVP